MRVPAARGHPSAPIPPRSVPGGRTTVVIVAITNGNVNGKDSFSGGGGRRCDKTSYLFHFAPTDGVGTPGRGPSRLRLQLIIANAENFHSDATPPAIHHSIRLHADTSTATSHFSSTRPPHAAVAVRPSVRLQPAVAGRVPWRSPIPCPVVPGAQR